MNYENVNLRCVCLPFPILTKAGGSTGVDPQRSASDGNLDANVTVGDLHKRMVSSKAVEVTH